MEVGFDFASVRLQKEGGKEVRSEAKRELVVGALR